MMVRMRDLFGRLLAALLLALLATGATARTDLSAAPEFQQGVRILEEAHRMPLPRDSRVVRKLLESPVQGDSERLRQATALLVMQSSVNDQSAQALIRHQSRLLAEDALGRPRTRIATVGEVIAFEQAQFRPLQELLAQVFHRWITVDLPPQEIVAMFPGGSLLKVEVLVRHAASKLELTGDFEVRVADPGAPQGTWQRGCSLPGSDNSAWQRQPDGARIARLSCTSHRESEPAHGFASAMERIRGGAQPEIVPGVLGRLALLPAHYEERLPYVEAARGVMAAGCMAAGTCATEVRWFLRGLPSILLLGVFIVLQAALCGWLLWRARHVPPQPAAWRSAIAVAYLLIVVVAHVLAIGFAAGLDGGGLLLLVAWIYLGIPLFLPGVVAGALAIRSGLRSGQLYQARIILGALALTFPLLDWVLMDVLKSGYGG